MSEAWHGYAVNEIERSGRVLNAWEQNFLFSNDHANIGIKHKLEMGLSLSKAQEDKLIQIHSRVTEIRRLRR